MKSYEEVLQKALATGLSEDFVSDEANAALVQRLFSWNVAGKDVKTYMAFAIVAITAGAATQKGDKIDIRALMTSAPRGYNAAYVAKATYTFGVDNDLYFGGAKAIPFNNSPFNGKRRVDRSWQNVSKAYKETFADFCDFLDEIAGKNASFYEALLAEVMPVARAKFLERNKPIALPKEGEFGRHTVVALEDFVSEKSDDGKRGQALVAAIYGAFYKEPFQVSTQNVHDPSRHGPGDVHLRAEDGVLLLPVEVKQKPVVGADIVEFAREVSRWTPTPMRCVYVTLHNDVCSELEDWSELATSKTGVVTRCFRKAVHLFDDLLAANPEVPVAVAAREVVSQMGVHLLSVDASDETLDGFRDLVAQM